VLTAVKAEKILLLAASLILVLVMLLVADFISILVKVELVITLFDILLFERATSG